MENLPVHRGRSSRSSQAPTLTTGGDCKNESQRARGGSGAQAILELVAEAERREREQQLLEEKRQIELMEKSRLERVTAHFDKMNRDLASLHEHQAKNITARHRLAFAGLQKLSRTIRVAERSLLPTCSSRVQRRRKL